jgi:hypothetical protein
MIKTIIAITKRKNLSISSGSVLFQIQEISFSLLNYFKKKRIKYLLKTIAGISSFQNYF